MPDGTSKRPSKSSSSKPSSKRSSKVSPCRNFRLTYSLELRCLQEPPGQAEPPLPQLLLLQGFSHAPAARPQLTPEEEETLHREILKCEAERRGFQEQQRQQEAGSSGSSAIWQICAPERPEREERRRQEEAPAITGLSQTQSPLAGPGTAPGVWLRLRRRRGPESQSQSSQPGALGCACERLSPCKVWTANRMARHWY